MKGTQRAADIFTVNSFSLKTKDSERQKILRRCDTFTSEDTETLLTFHYLLSLLLALIHNVTHLSIHPSIHLSIHPFILPSPKYSDPAVLR